MATLKFNYVCCFRRTILQCSRLIFIVISFWVVGLMYRSGQVQSTSNASHANIGSTQIYGHQSYGDTAVDSTYNVKNVNTAWGGQRFPHEVRSTAFVYGG